MSRPSPKTKVLTCEEIAKRIAALNDALREQVGPLRAREDGVHAWHSQAVA